MRFVICLENVHMRGTYEIHKKRELPHIIQMILQQFLDFHTDTYFAHKGRSSEGQFGH